MNTHAWKLVLSTQAHANLTQMKDVHKGGNQRDMKILLTSEAIDNAFNAEMR